MRPQRLFSNSGSPNQRPSRQFPQNQARRVARSYGRSPIWISPRSANSGWTRTPPKHSVDPPGAYYNYYEVLSDNGDDNVDCTPADVTICLDESFPGQSKAERKAQHHAQVKRRARNRARRNRRKKQKLVTECVLASTSNKTFGRNTWLGDTAASTHMGNSDEGMTDVEEISQPITIGNGKQLRATKIGTLHRTVFQEDGSSIDIKLNDYKYVPDLHVNLFSITKSLDQGWNLSNKGVIIQLRRGNTCLTFDKIFGTNMGKVVGVELLPRTLDKDNKGFAFVDTETETTPTSESVTPKTGIKSSWDINRMHRVFNHASEDVLRRIAKEKNWHISGKFETCKDCKESNAQQKNVSKCTTVRSAIPGERLFIDITSIKAKSIGGSKFWLVIVDDATSMTWSMFMKQKNHAAKHMLPFLLKLHKLGHPVKFIRCDSAGENKDLENKCQQEPTLCDIIFQYTPRDSPQYNGKVERKIAVLTGRVRSLLTAAGLPDKLRPQLWAEAAKTATDIENTLLPTQQGKSPYQAFGMMVPEFNFVRQFGEVAIVKFSKQIKSKLLNRGLPVIYLGRPIVHAADVH
jgi:hypothetical protein